MDANNDGLNAEMQMAASWQRYMPQRAVEVAYRINEVAINEPMI